MRHWSTTTEVAVKFGISVSTLKRLCDKHDIPLHKTPGGHRRIDHIHEDAVARILKLGASFEIDAFERVEQIYELLIEGNDHELLDFLWKCTVDPCKLLDELEQTLVPALWKIGDAWLVGEVSVPQEKVATTTAIRVIDSLALRFGARGRPLALGATLTGSNDSIASRLIVLGFRTHGISTLDLGAGVSPEHIAIAVETYDVDSIWISHTHVEEPGKVVELHEDLKRRLKRPCRVAVGGGGLAPSLRRSLSHCRYFESAGMYVACETSLLKSSLEDEC